MGYVDFNFTAGLHTVAYRGVACTLRNAKSGQYGGVRNFWLVTRGKAKGAANSWIRWIRKSRAARRIIGTHWVPLR
jgi:phosphate transport system substrate-binding protein